MRLSPRAVLVLTPSTFPSKLANILYANALQKHLNEENVHVLSLHPGMVHTELTRGVVASYGWFGVRLPTS